MTYNIAGLIRAYKITDSVTYLIVKKIFGSFPSILEIESPKDKNDFVIIKKEEDMYTFVDDKKTFKSAETFLDAYVSVNHSDRITRTLITDKLENGVLKREGVEVLK